jgi:hypothetical protein
LKRSPFQRFQSYMYSAASFAGGDSMTDARGRRVTFDEASQAPLFQFCKTLCLDGGNWLPSPNPVAGFKLFAVEAITHSPAYYAGYSEKQARMSEQRHEGGPYFNFDTLGNLNPQQQLVLSTLRQRFHERAPGTPFDAPHTFYSFHGPRRENLASMCSTGIVATRGLDAGYFGSGCYSTLNIEYAVRYIRGDFDKPTSPRRTRPSDGKYPVIMFACSVGMAYPITPGADYGNVVGVPAGCSDYYGRPLKQQFDCHVICVNKVSNFQAVNRDQCQYVEVVIADESQMMPVAVLWFEEL